MAKWQAFFVLKNGLLRLGRPCKTQNEAWKSCAEILADESIEWVGKPGHSFIREYGIVKQE